MQEAPQLQDQFNEVARTDESGWQDKEAVQDQHAESATSSVHQRLGPPTVKAKAGVAGSGKGQEATQDQHVMPSTSSVRQRLGLLTVKPKAGVAGSECDH